MSKRILVVEDQEDLRIILRDFPSASGDTVIEAVDSAESVAKAASERPDLVLMDIQLPVLDGYDATQQIKALPGFTVISRREVMRIIGQPTSDARRGHDNERPLGEKRS
jgi:two-component system, cell cycle response regulator DivK